MQRQFPTIAHVSVLLSFLVFAFITPAALAGAIGVTKTDGHETAAPGDTLTYSIVITNAKAKNVRVDVEDVIPPSTTFLSASDGGIPRGKLNDWRVNWGNLLIPMQGSRTITVTVRVKAGAPDGTVITNTVNVKAPAVSTATDTTTVENPVDQTGSLFVTKSTTPVRSHQLLGGTLGDPVLRLALRAEIEDIDVTRLVFTNTGDLLLPVSIHHLELFRIGEGTPFAMAMVDACDGNPANAYCAEMLSQQLVIPGGEMVDVLVRPLLKTDEMGAISTELVQLELRGDMAALARGVSTGDPLAVNDGDATAEGEVFIGTDVPAANAPITGNPNDVVLAKIITIENTNPDPDGTDVPVGTNKTIAEFKFTAATNSNTLNGLNKATLSGIIFNVASTNVTFTGSNFNLFNKNDATQQIDCMSNTTATASGSFFVECRHSMNTSVDLEMDSGEAVTLVLEADIINNQVDATQGSSLVVSLANFSDRSMTMFGKTSTDSHVQWSDHDTAATAHFTWIENDNTEIFSTMYDL